jgi:ATP-dependent DNA ligase
MLAALIRELPRGSYVYEPKWDGFRCLAFVDDRGARVDLQSRHGKPLGRYFPELASALAEIDAPGFVLDGEILIETEAGSDFGALLQQRTHPSATRVDRLARETPASYVAFDLLGVGDDDLRDRPFEERRARLLELLASPPPSIRVTPATEDPAVASRWLAEGRGIDGVIAKRRELLYTPGKRAMIKVKPERTVECVLAGVRLSGTPASPAVASLLLGLWDGDALRHVGVVSQLRGDRRAALIDELRELITDLEGHPWEHGFQVEASPIGRLPGAASRWVPGEMTRDWVPLRPERVIEVAYDHADGQRFRHPARFVRWRPDREPRSCTIEQLR